MELSTSSHWCREVMDARTKKLVSEIDYKSLECLEISGNKWEKAGFGKYTSLCFPDFDICKKIKMQMKYDLIIAEQVFEHIEDPSLAIKNIYTLLKPGGYFLISVPFLIKWHPCPYDFWRWTKDGLNIFLQNAKFNVIEVNSWGNKDCVIENLEEWKMYNPETHSLINDPNYPVVVWGLCQKKRNKNNNL